MKKIVMYSLSFLLALGILVPMSSFNVFASEDTAVEIEDGIMVVQVTEDTFQIINEKEGTTDIVEYVAEDSAIVTESNGVIHNITFDKNGNAYDNGILVSEVKAVNVEGNANEFEKPFISTRGMNGPWMKSRAVRTTRSFHNTVKSVAITIVGFIPGFGYIAGATAIISAIWDYGQREVYFERIYYIDTSCVWEKSNMYAYKNDNYTGLLSTTYGGPIRIHW